METLNIKVIMGSVRDRRFNEHATKWISDIAKKRDVLDVEVIDLKDWQFPFYTDAKSSSQYQNGDYPTDIRKNFAKKIAEADGFIFVTPEYNNSMSGVLKNAIDQVYAEWNNKAAAIVSYGTTGGARASTQLRMAFPEMQIAGVRAGVYILAPWMLVDENNQLKAGALDTYEHGANTILDQLTNWSKAFKAMRAGSL